MTRRCALLIGTANYSDRKIPDLRSPAADVAALADILKDEQKGRYDDVEVAVNLPYHQIQESIGKLFDNRDIDDTVLLYFSGHGFRNEDGDLFLGARNTGPNSLEYTGVSAHLVSRLIDKTRSRKVIVVLDCCFSGAFDRTLSPALKSVSELATQVQGILEGEGRIVFTSSTAVQSAFESEDGPLSVFTGLLTQGLGTGAADVDNDGYITSTDLYQYLTSQFRVGRHQQTPTLSARGLKGDVVVAFAGEHGATTKDAHVPLEIWLALQSPIAKEREEALLQTAALEGVKTADEDSEVIRRLRTILADDDSYRVRKACSDVLKKLGHRVRDVRPAPIARGPFPAGGTDWVSDRLESWLDDVERRSTRESDQPSDDPSTLRLNLGDFDIRTGGIRKGELCVFLDRDSRTRTSYLLDDIVFELAADQGRIAFLVTLDRSQKDVIEELLSEQAQIDYWRLAGGYMTDAEWQRLAKSTGRFAGARMRIIDAYFLDLDSLRDQCRENAPNLLAITGLHNAVPSMQDSGALAAVLDDLRTLASELGISILVTINPGLGAWELARSVIERFADVCIEVHPDKREDGFVRFGVSKNPRGGPYWIRFEDGSRWLEFLRMEYESQFYRDYELLWGDVDDAYTRGGSVLEWEADARQAQDQAVQVLAELRESLKRWPSKYGPELEVLSELLARAQRISHLDSREESSQWGRVFRHLVDQANGRSTDEDEGAPFLFPDH